MPKRADASSVAPLRTCWPRKLARLEAGARHQRHGSALAGNLVLIVVAGGKVLAGMDSRLLRRAQRLAHSAQRLALLRGGQIIRQHKDAHRKATGRRAFSGWRRRLLIGKPAVVRVIQRRGKIGEAAGLGPERRRVQGDDSDALDGQVDGQRRGPVEPGSVDGQRAKADVAQTDITGNLLLSAYQRTDQLATAPPSIFAPLEIRLLHLINMIQFCRMKTILLQAADLSRE